MKQQRWHNRKLFPVFPQVVSLLKVSVWYKLYINKGVVSWDMNPSPSRNTGLLSEACGWSSQVPLQEDNWYCKIARPPAGFGVFGCAWHELVRPLWPCCAVRTRPQIDTEQFISQGRKSVCVRVCMCLCLKSLSEQRCSGNSHLTANHQKPPCQLCPRTAGVWELSHCFSHSTSGNTPHCRYACP